MNVHTWILNMCRIFAADETIFPPALPVTVNRLQCVQQKTKQKSMSQVMDPWTLTNAYSPPPPTTMHTPQRTHTHTHAHTHTCIYTHACTHTSQMSNQPDGSRSEWHYGRSVCIKTQVVNQTKSFSKLVVQTVYKIFVNKIKPIKNQLCLCNNWALKKNHHKHQKNPL